MLKIWNAKITEFYSYKNNCFIDAPKTIVL